MTIKASIIIPTYNRKAILHKTLTAIIAQSIPAFEYEIIVIDDGSTDGTREMIENLAFSKQIKYVYQSNQGRAKARNQGIRVAQGGIIIFIDSDIIVNHNFVQAHIHKHSTHPNAIVNGVVINTDNFKDPTSEKLKVTDHSRASFATGNSSVKKVHLLKAGLFDEDFNQYGWEDLELGHRLLALGLTKIKAPNAIGYHYNPPVSLDYLPELLRKEKERGRMALLFYQKNPTFRTRMTTLYAWPFFLIERLINLGSWPEWQITEALLEWLKRNGKTKLFRFIAQFKLIHAYFTGMREGRKRFER